MSVSIKVDLQPFQDWVRKVTEGAEKVSADFYREASSLIIEQMRLMSPKRSGALAASISAEETAGGLTVGPKVPYALFVELGTSPHMIFPRTAKALRFEMGGKAVFAKYVRHPGFPGRFFVRATYQAVMPKLQEIMTRLWKVLISD